MTSRGPLGEPPPLGSASMGGFPPFASGAKFRFDPKVNVLIGPNGVGKSIALGIFAGERQEQLARVSDEASGRDRTNSKTKRRHRGRFQGFCWSHASFANAGDGHARPSVAGHSRDACVCN